MSPMEKRMKTRVGAASIQNLPAHIFQTVLQKLSTISLIICKCVCKSWRDQILDPEFKLHYPKSLYHHEACPIIRPWHPTRVSRSLYLILPDHQDPSIQGSDRVVKNVVELKIPLRNPEEVIGKHADKNHKMTSCMSIKTNDNQYDVVNSCNGFLLLAERHHNDPVVVCNPVTGEFVHLPEASTFEKPKHQRGYKGVIDCALGFSPKTNTYKVVRMVHDRRPEILTLGEDSWKEFVGKAPELGKKKLVEFPVYLNGVIYWLYDDDSLHSFNLDYDKFFQIPIEGLKFKNRHPDSKMRLGVLGGEVCLCEAGFSRFDANVWVAEDNCRWKPWWKKIRILKPMVAFRSYISSPLKYIKKDFMMISGRSINSLLYYYKGKMRLFKVKRDGIKYFEVLAHVPNLTSLKDILVEGSDVQILNVNSRCANWRLCGEAPAVIMQEELKRESMPWTEYNFR